MRTLLGLSLALLVMGCPDDLLIAEDDLSVRADMSAARDMSGAMADLRPALTAAVNVDDFFYAPQMVTIGRGGTVTWTWKGGSPHTVTADDGATFVSPEQTTGTFLHTFNAAGTFDYHCQVHGTSMSGTVTVQ